MKISSPAQTPAPTRWARAGHVPRADRPRALEKKWEEWRRAERDAGSHTAFFLRRSAPPPPPPR